MCLKLDDNIIHWDLDVLSSFHNQTYCFDYFGYPLLK